LKLNINASEVFVELAQHFKLIAQKCKQINIFHLELKQISSNDCYQILNTISYFKQLKYLCFDNVEDVNNAEHVGDVEDNNQFLSKSLKDCSNLTHLALYYIKMNDNFFEDIDIYLPKLKILCIEVDEITDKAMYSMAKLHKLETVKLRANKYFKRFNHITDSGICHLINNCQQIKSIEFCIRLDITLTTIEQLVKLALTKPKVQFKHEFRFVGYKDNLLINNYLKNLPINLVINVYDP